MKFNLLALFVVLFEIVACSMAFKNPECGEPHSQAGGDGITCLAIIPMVSYNPDLKECVDFNYGGCLGNNNRFDTKEICEAKCLE